MDKVASQLIAASEQQFLSSEFSDIHRKDRGFSRTYSPHRQYSAVEFAVGSWGSPTLY